MNAVYKLTSKHEAGFLGNIPQPLYKYRVWEEPCAKQQFSKRLLTENEIYLASADQFNDPFDCSLPFRYNPEDLTPEKIFLKLLNIGRKIYPHLTESELYELCYARQNSEDFLTGDFMKYGDTEFKNTVNQTFGILSLSAKNDDILMWSHYANSHQGFCVGLDKYVLFDLCKGEIGPVRYDDDFPLIPLLDESPAALSILTTTKSKHWTYEQEFRIVSIDGSRRVVKLPNEAIMEVILGAKMPEKYKDEIYPLLNAKFPHAKIFESHIDSEKFKLDMIPLIKRHSAP